MTELTRAELRTIYTLLNASRDRDVPALQEKIRIILAERAGVRELGAKVFELQLPLSVQHVLVRGKKAGKIVTRSLAPTLNVYGSMKVFARAELYKELDARILAELAKWPRARLRGAARPRAVRVTRRSSVMPDEITVDVIGGKVPVDRLVIAGVLVGDSAGLLLREAQWQQVPPKGGSLLVEVFELADYTTPA